MNNRIKKSATVLSACFTAICLIYLIFCAVRIGNEYLPFWTDEFMYLSDTNSFLLTGDPGTAIIYEESFSKIGDFGHHGFVYTIYDAFVSKIFGFGENVNVVYVNLVTFVASLLLIAALPRVEKTQKILLTGLCCGNYMILAYLFTYMQEIIHLPITILAAFLLFKIYTTKRNLKFLVASFIILILFATLLRPNWIFWLAGLIPVARTGKQAVIVIAGFVFMSLLAALGFPQLNGVYTVGFFNTLGNTLSQGEYLRVLILVLKHSVLNVLRYISPADDANWSYTLTNYLPVAGAIFLFFTGKEEVKRFYFAVVLIIIVNLLAIFLLYDVRDWREVRMMSPAVYLIFATLVFTRHDIAVLVLLCVQLLFGVSTYLNVESAISARQNMYQRYQQIPDLCREIKSLDRQIITSKTPTILLELDEFYGDGRPEMLCFPLQNTEGTRLRYSVNLLRKKDELNLEKIDYYITQQPVESLSFEQIYQTEFFKLYRIRKPLPFTTTTDKSSY
jgi:hypothetical protein